MMMVDRIPREFWYTRAFRVVPNRFWGGLADSFGFCSIRLSNSTFERVHFRACSVMTSSNLQVIVLAFMFSENSERVFCLTADELCLKLPISDDPNAVVTAHFRPNVENHDYETVAYEDWTSAKALADSVAHNGLFDFVFIGATPELRKFLYQMQVLPGIAVPLPLRSSLVQNASNPTTTTAATTTTVTASVTNPATSITISPASVPKPSVESNPDSEVADAEVSSQQQASEELSPSEGSSTIVVPAAAAAAEVASDDITSGDVGCSNKSISDSPTVISSGTGASTAASSSSSASPSPFAVVPTDQSTLEDASDHPSKGSIIMPYVPKNSRPRTRYRFLDCIISSDGEVIVDGFDQNGSTGGPMTERQQQQQQQQQVKDVLDGVRFPRKRKRTSRSKILEMTQRKVEQPEPVPEPETPKQYNCRWLGCHESFPSMSALTAHTHYHTYECPDCVCRWEGCQRAGKPFPNHAGLYRHIRYHTGDKPCKCPINGCTYCSVDNGELLRHMKQVHNIVINS